METFEEGIARALTEIDAGGSPAQLFEKERHNQEIHRAKLDLAIALADFSNGFDPINVASAVEELFNVMLKGAKQ